MMCTKNMMNIDNNIMNKSDGTWITNEHQEHD
jgi:hypothetical protein